MQLLAEPNGCGKGLRIFPHFENMGLIIHPNLHRTIDGGVGSGGVIVLVIRQYRKCRITVGKISKAGATRCQIFRLKCTKFAFLWGYAPNPAGGAYSAPPDF